MLLSNYDEHKGLIMELINEFLLALYNLSNAMAIYILVGLLFAGILHELVPETLVTKHLGKENIGSVLKATLFGIPLPVCSCGVIPLATSIKKSGASNGATLSFLISTPITGVDAILATFGMFGWIFTFYRVVTSMIIAIIAGVLTNLFGSDTSVQKESRFSIVKPQEVESSCETSCCCHSEEAETKRSFSFSKAYHYAFTTLLGDIAKPLFWGLIFGALITIIIPDNLSEILVQYPMLSYIIVIAIAVPMYVCATSSLPIAAALIIGGVSPGAAFVFLTAGPATNTVTIGVVKKMLGKRALAIYLGVIIVGSMIFGLGLDWVFSANEISVLEMLHLHEEANFFEIASSVLLWGFILYFLGKGLFPKRESQTSSSVIP
jgi:uncharacterized protein